QQPYRWADNVSLLNVAHEHLPLIDEAFAHRFIAKASEIMAAAGWEPINSKPNGKPVSPPAAVARANMTGNSIYGRTALRDECAALAAMRKDSGRNNALNTAAFSLFQLVAGGELDEEKDQVRERLFAAAQACKLVAE